jgi:L-asparagine transporter-like permease
MFGIGRMMRSLADEGHAPRWLKDKKDVPYRSIIFSGAAMLLGLGLGMLLPSVYLFLISAGGFALLFTYAVIVAAHIKYRKKNGRPVDGKCLMPGYPYSSLIALISMIIIILSMPFISGQASGLIAGCIMVVIYAAIYGVMKFARQSQRTHMSNIRPEHIDYGTNFSVEFSEELTEGIKEKGKD